MYGNANAPPAVAYSAIIYSLRGMVTRDIPLNQVFMGVLIHGHEGHPTNHMLMKQGNNSKRTDSTWN